MARSRRFFYDSQQFFGHSSAAAIQLSRHRHAEQFPRRAKFKHMTCCRVKKSRDTSIRFNEETGRIPFAIGRELSAILRRRHFVNASRKFCCTAIMKRQTSKNWRAILVSVLWTRLTLQNWRAKLISLLLATTLWYLIKKNIETTPSPSETPSPAPVTKTR